MNTSDIPVSPVSWVPCFRAIPSAYPPISFFDRIADPGELDDRETAIRETVHHREKFLAATREQAMEIGMRMLQAHLNAVLHDIRGYASRWPEVYHESSYTESQAVAHLLRERRSWGIAYDSVRHPGGECAAVFNPHAVSNCWPAELLVYEWDGSRIAEIREAPRV